MRKVFLGVAIIVSVGGLCGCASTGAHPEAGVPGGGVTGATIKRAAVHNPDTLDFGKDVESLPNYDLDSQSVSMDKTAPDADTERDKEIDNIVNTITDDSSGKAHTSPQENTTARPSAPGHRPAVPVKSSAADGVTAETSADDTAGSGATAALPPLPATTPPADALKQANATEQAQIFQKPLWRRQHDKDHASDSSHDPVPSNN